MTEESQEEMQSGCQPTLKTNADKLVAGELERASSHSRGSDNVGEESVSSDNGFSTPQDQGSSPDSRATTPVALSQTTLVGTDFLKEMRRAIREEVVEAVQKYNRPATAAVIPAVTDPSSSYYAQYATISSASGSAASSNAPSPVTTVTAFAIPEEPVTTTTNTGAAHTTALATPQQQQKKPGVRFSDQRTFSRRPASVRRASAGAEINGLGVEWGLLFDVDGCATHRLGQFLRGLAKHMIDEFPPKSSLVVTPEKLGILYSRYRVEKEVVPYIDIFTSKSKDANDRIAKFYSDLNCQYHLVQHESRSKPRIPALTPAGFAHYYTMCILAYPEDEFCRLKHMVADMPTFADISSTGMADGGRPQQQERMPTHLARSLLPAKYDASSRKMFDKAVDDLIYELRHSSSSGIRSPAMPDSKRVSGSGSGSGSGSSHHRSSWQSNDREPSSKTSGCGSSRRRFEPGALQTIADKSPRGDGKEDTEGSESDRNRQSGHGRYGHQRRRTVDLHLPPGRVALANQSTNSSNNSSSNLKSFSQSQPSTPTGIMTLPPPPVGGNRASICGPLSSRRPHSPSSSSSFAKGHHRHHHIYTNPHSASLPDVNMTMVPTTSSPVSSSSSHNPFFPPSSLSPTTLTLEHGNLLNSLIPSSVLAEEKRNSGSLVPSSSELQWTGGGPSSSLAAGAVTAPGIGPGLEGRRERQQRHRRSANLNGSTVASETVGVDVDDRGPTWEEFLKSHKRG